MWQHDCTFYQIYPLGLCGAPAEQDGVPANRLSRLAPWPDYLAGLGVGAVLFNPLFESDRHGYDTRDLRRVDTRLGTNADFAALCRAFHDRGLRVVLDGVFNHVGRGFWAFQDVLKHREQSPYRDWFHLRFDGQSPYGDGLSYEGWEGHYNLVKLNLQNPAVVGHLLDSVGFWMDEFGIDGLRLDVAYCLDPAFLTALRRYCDEKKPGFFLVGEVLFGDYRRIVNDGMLHSCTNYECYKGLHSSLNDGNLFELAHSLGRQFGPEDWTIYRGLHLMTFADNHDVSRLASILRDGRMLPVAYALLFAMPGIPCLYYGSEWGQTGRKQDGDDALRPALEAPVEHDLSRHIARLIALRRGSRALREGGYRNLLIQNRALLFSRTWDGEEVQVAVNIDEHPQTLPLDFGGRSATELLTGRAVAGGGYTLPPFTAALFRVE